jgi:small subunit ribosomal protein S8
MKLFCNLTSKLKTSIQSHQSYVILPKNIFYLKFLKLLFLEGFISRIVPISSLKLKVFLKYSANGTPSFKEIKFLSKPGKISYVSYNELTKAALGVGLIVVSTNKGLMSHHSCIKFKIGGTALCYII